MRPRAILVPLLLAALAAVLMLGVTPTVGAAAVTRYEQNASQLSYSGTWSVGSSALASSGSFRWANAGGMAVTATFKGTSLAWIAKMGPNYGIAAVSLDGAAPVDVDLYRGTAVFQQKVWETGALGAGYHTAVITWTGRRNTAATDTNIGVDAFDVLGTLVGVTRAQQTDRRLGWRGNWIGQVGASFSGGTAWVANASGASATIAFDGVSLRIVGTKGPGYGFAGVKLDNGATVTVDLYNSTDIYQRTVWSSGLLKPGRHVVTVTWTGKKRLGATGAKVGIDALDLRGALTAAPASQLSFSQTNLMDHLHVLAVDIGVRHGGSPQELQAALYGMNHFKSLGYSTQITDVPLPDGTTSHNVIATKPGSSPLTVVIGAHMDSYGLSPGGNDNGSGAAAVLELARAIRGVNLVPTVVLVLFGHEEPMGDGNADHHHYGSRRYVATMTADQKANLAGMISLDMIGAGTTFTVRYMEKGPRTLVNLLLGYSTRTGDGAVYLKDPSTYGYSDHEPFELAGYPAAWLEWREATYYHTAADTYATVTPAKAQLCGGMVAGFLAGLRSTDLQAMVAARR